MKLSTRLTLAMVTLVLLTATTIGLLTYRGVVAVIVPRALERIDADARVIATELAASTRGARNDVIGFRSSAMDGIIRASVAGDIDAATQARWLDPLTARFAAELTAKPEYSQFRLIGIADSGREIVRVDRSGPNGAIRVVPEGELRRQGDQEYFKEAVRLPAGAIYVSRVDLNQELGVIETPRVPTLRVATGVHAPDGKPFGIFVVNVDLRAAFARVRSAQRLGARIYVINEGGDYLVHPDPSREFGFQFGKPARIQDELPDFAELLAQTDTTPRAMANYAGERLGLGWEIVHLAGGPWVAVVETIPYAQVVGAATTARNSSLLGGLAAVLGALAVAVVLGRSVTRPLVQMTRAVDEFARSGTIAALPHGGGEIGVLASAFAHVASNMREKTSALKQEMEDRRRLFETSADLILITDSHGKLTRVSPSSTATLGLSPEEMIGRNAARFIHPEDLEPARDEMRLARSRNRMRNFETRYVHKDGRAVTLAWTGVWSEQGRQYFFIGRDMTDRNLAEEKFRFAVEASPSGIVMTDASGAIVLVNAETERMFGYEREELLGQAVDILNPTSLRGRHDAHRIDFAAQPEKRRMGAGRELYGRRKDGTEFPVEIGLNPIHTSAGLLVMSVIVDLSESKQAKEALLDSEQMASGIIDTALDAFVQLDETGTIIGWSPKSEVMFGWSSQEAIGQKLRDLVIPERNRAAISDRLAQFLRESHNGTPGRRYEAPSLRRDGKEFDTEVSLTALRRRNGCVINGFIRDITDRVATEEQLRHAYKMEAIGQLTGGIAHDFNNMLTVIVATIDILAEAVADKPQLATIARLIGEAADRGAELTGHLLAFARKQPLQPTETDINALIDKSAKLMRSTLRENIEIETILTAAAWPAFVDPGQLSSALLNLALNARDAMEDGGKLTLETDNVVFDEEYARLNSDVEPGDYVLIAVSDTGSGIAESIRYRIFEPFFSTKAVGKGTGLGLSMVYGFVKQSNGHIKVYSEEGHGTTFKIYLPRGRETQSRQITDTRSEALIEGGDETILVVEDDGLVRSTAITHLEALGYRTISAANAAEALAIVNSGVSFDLLFTDVIMPGPMNGCQLAEVIAKRRFDVKVLFTSGYTENALVQGRLDRDVLLLAKPYRRHELARMVRVALGRYPAPAAAA